MKWCTVNCFRGQLAAFVVLNHIEKSYGLPAGY